MSTIRYRFTLDHTTKGSQEVDKVDGWKDIEFILERDKEFNSLIEIVETPLIFFGDARDYILDVIDTYGVDEEVTITIDISTDDGDSYNEIFDGTLSLEFLEEVYEGDTSYKVKVPILPNLFWQKFMNRKETPVKVSSLTDRTSLDGETTALFLKHTLNLPSQWIRKTTEVRRPEDDLNGIQLEYGSDQTNHTVYGILTFPRIVYDEVDDRFTYPMGFADTHPETDRRYMFKCKERGVYNIDILAGCNIIVATTGIANVGDYDIETFLVHISGEDRTEYSLGSNSGTEGTTQLSINISHSTNDQGLLILEDDLLYVYNVVTVDNGEFFNIRYTGSSSTETRIVIRANTETDATTAQTVKIHEAAHSITNLILSENDAFESNYLGNTSTSNKSYASDGEGSNYAIARGVQIRGLSDATYPLEMSFMDWWTGINPILNLGLTYEKTDSSPFTYYIKCEELRHFYDDTPHDTISNIENLVREIDQDRFYKLIKVGYRRWKAEEIALLDDPQTVKEYALRFKTFGSKVDILSTFYAAGIGIEQTRRVDRDEEDWRLDDEIMIIQLDPSSLANPYLFDSSPNGIELLTNSETRYNIKITPARNLLRNMNWLSSGLTKYAGSEYQYQRGEGNTRLRTTISESESGDYNNIQLDEDEDIAWDYGGSPLKDEQSPIFVNEIYTFEYPMSYSEYQNYITDENRKKSIEISTSESGHFSVFILRLGYNPYIGKANFRVIKAYA